VIHRVPEPEVMDDESEARAYEDGDFLRVNLAFARRASRLLPQPRGHALDLGTGPAEIPILFCGLRNAWRVTAVDASAAMLRLARRNVRLAGLERRIHLVRADAKNLRSLRRRVDAVLSNSLLHHLPDPLPFWREVRRVCRPGGVVLVQDLRRPRSRAAARALVRRHAADDSPLLRQLFYRSLLAAFTPAEVREQLRSAGLELEVRATTDRHLVVWGRR
jgi:ubiquinone/menaquinone biosynthesis C-methylase UbiE